MKLLLKFSIVAVLAIAVTGCSKGYQPSNTMLQPSNTMPYTAATTVHAIPWCRTSQLSISGGQPNGAAGTVGIIGIGLQNISNTTCRVKGYPKLQMLNVLGKPIPTYTIQGTAYYGPSSIVKVVNLTPYFRARFDLLFHNQTGYGTAICPTSTYIQFTPPNSKQPITLPWKLAPYGGGSVQHLVCGQIKVSPIYVS